MMDVRSPLASFGLCAVLLMASSVFGAVLMGGLEWLVFEPERSRDDVAAIILQSLSGSLKPAV